MVDEQINLADILPDNKRGGRHCHNPKPVVPRNPKPPNPIIVTENQTTYTTATS